MARSKGTAKTGGRKAGTPNKNTTVARTVVAELLADMLPEVKRRLPNLDDAEYCRLFKDLLPYAVAKVQPTPADATTTATTELEDMMASMFGEV